jgi:hypothetical protein
LFFWGESYFLVAKGHFIPQKLIETSKAEKRSQWQLDKQTLVDKPARAPYRSSSPE